jgi:hypothetical protein
MNHDNFNGWRSFKLTAKIQDPELGKGWYTAHVSYDEKTDSEVLDIVKGVYPNSVGFQIMREYHE